MGIKEKNLPTASGIASGDLIREVTSGGISKCIDYNKLAKAIIENYNGSTIAGSAQTLQAAINSLNSNSVPAYLPDTITDLNSITYTSVYIIRGTVPANAPTTGTYAAFVRTTCYGSQIFQEYIKNSGSAAGYYVRRYLNNAWTAWASTSMSV